MKLFQKLVISCWTCPLFDRDRQICKKTGKHIWNKILDEETISEDCTLPDIDQKDWHPI